MGMFDWVKQLENGVGGAIGGAVQGVEHLFSPAPAAPAAPAQPNIFQQAGSAVSGGIHSLLAQFGQQAPPKPAAAPIFKLQPPPGVNPTALAPKLNLPPNASPAQVKAAQFVAANGGPVDPNYKSTKPSLLDDVKQAVGGTASDAMHMVTQVPVHLALEGTDMLNSIDHNTTDNEAQFQAKPGSIAGKIFGTDPITSYSNQADQFSSWLDGHGIHGTAAKALAIPVAPILATLDLGGGKGGDAKAAASEIAKATTAEDVAKVLTAHVGAENAAKVPAPVLDALAKETDPAKITTIIKSAAHDATTAPAAAAAEKSPQLQAAQSLMHDTGKTADQLSAQVNATREGLIRNEMGNMLDELRAGKVSPGSLNRAEDGTVVGRQGRFSTNPEWYKQMYRTQADTGIHVSKQGIESAIANARPNSKLYTQLRHVAETRLNGHYVDPVSGAIPHNKTFVGAGHVLQGITEHKALPTPPSSDMEKWTAMGGKPEDFPFTEDHPAPDVSADTTPGNTSVHSGQELTPGLHEPLPVRSTPATPMLSSEHMDIPGKAPVDVQRAKINLAPPKTESSAVKTITSIRNVISRQGAAGKELASKIVAVRERHAQLGQVFQDAIPTVRSLSKSDMKNFVDTVEGKAGPASKKIAAAVNEWQAATRNIEDQANKAGITMGHIESYFPHMYENKFFSNKKTYNDAINHLVNTGQASDIGGAVQMLNDMRAPWQGGHKYGNLEKARTANLPGYRTDKNVVGQYIDRASRRIAEAEHFGPYNEHVDTLVGRIAKEGKDANAAQTAFNSYFNPEHNGAVDKLANKARGASSVLTLSKAAISHSTQTANTAIVGGALRTARAWTKTILSPADRAWVKRIGVNYDAHAGGHVSAVAPGLRTMRKINRTVSALVGRSYGDAMAARGKIDELRRWGVQGDIAIDSKTGKHVLSDTQQVHMAHAMADATQFSNDAADLPAWARTPAGKLVGQYRMSYTYKQGGFIFDHIIKEAGRGNLAPALRALAIVPVAGAAVIEAKHALGNKATPTSDPLATAEAGGAGNVPLSLADSLKYMYDGPSTAENVASDVAPLAGQAVQTGINIHNAMGGNKAGLGKQVLSYIPFVGNLVKNAVYPSSPTDPNAIAYVQAMDTAGKTLSSSKDQSIFDALYGSNKDSSGNKIPASYDPNNSPYVAEALLSHPNVLAAATSFYRAFNAKTGQPIDPLYNLNPTQQQAALNVRAAAAFPGELSSDKKQLATELPANYQAEQTAYYNSVSASLASAGQPSTQPGAPVYPEPTAQVQANLNAGNTKDPAVQAWLDQLTQYNNQKRALMGLPAIATYGLAASGSQIPNPSDPYATKLAAGTAANPTFASTKSGGTGSRGGKVSFPKGSSTVKVAKVKLTKVKAPKMPKVKLAKATSTFKIKQPKLVAYKKPRVTLA